MVWACEMNEMRTTTDVITGIVSGRKHTLLCAKRQVCRGDIVHLYDEDGRDIDIEVLRHEMLPGGGMLLGIRALVVSDSKLATKGQKLKRKHPEPHTRKALLILVRLLHKKIQKAQLLREQKVREQKTQLLRERKLEQNNGISPR